MGIHLEMVDHDKLFEETMLSPILVNDFDLSNAEQLDKLNNLIYTTYDQDSLEVVPSCDCGDVKGEYNVGIECPNCNTPCLSVTEKPLESVLWIGAPDGVVSLISPQAWIVMNKAFTTSGVSALEYLTNPNYRTPNGKTTEVIEKIRKMEFKGEPVKRSLNFFLENFDELMEKLILGKIIKFGTVKARHEFYDFIKQNRDKLFSQHIPIPSKVAFIKEDTDMGKYADATHLPAIDAIRTISSISNSSMPLSQAQLESKVVNVMVKLEEYYTNFYNKTLSPKPGWLRKHVYGSRIHFSARAVITSITEPHQYDEIELPWSLSVQFLKVHLQSKLIKIGFTPNEAIRHINEHTLKYDILLDKLFRELIDEGPGNRIRVGLQRNPSLTRGSLIHVGVSRVKTNPKDNTIGLSVLVLSALNADFDGDALNLMLVHDEYGYERMRRLDPHLYVFDINKPRSLSGFMALPAPVVANIANFIHGEDKY